MEKIKHLLFLFTLLVGTAFHASALTVSSETLTVSDRTINIDVSSSTVDIPLTALITLDGGTDASGGTVTATLDITGANPSGLSVTSATLTGIVSPGGNQATVSGNFQIQIPSWATLFTGSNGLIVTYTYVGGLTEASADGTLVFQKVFRQPKVVNLSAVTECHNQAVALDFLNGVVNEVGVTYTWSLESIVNANGSVYDYADMGFSSAGQSAVSAPSGIPGSSNNITNGTFTATYKFSAKSPDLSGVTVSDNLGGLGQIALTYYPASNVTTGSVSGSPYKAAGANSSPTTTFVVAPNTNGPFQWEFVSGGTNILNGLTTTAQIDFSTVATASINATGIIGGTYQVKATTVPSTAADGCGNDFRGFTVSSYSGISAVSNVIIESGDALNVSLLTKFLGTADGVRWELQSDVSVPGNAAAFAKLTGLVASGTGDITSANVTNTDVNNDVTVVFKVVPTEGGSDGITYTTFDLTVKKITPTPLASDVTMSVASTVGGAQSVTAVTEVGTAFPAIVLHTEARNPVNGELVNGINLNYKIDFKTGSANLLGVTPSTNIIPGTTGADVAWTIPVPAYAAGGWATYTVTAILPVTDPVVSASSFDFTFVVLDNSNIILPGGGFQTVLNGDLVPAYTFPVHNLPPGSTVQWSFISASAPTSSGYPAGTGYNTLPAFTANNTDATNSVTLTYNAFITNNGVTAATPAVFNIQVDPAQVQDTQLEMTAVENITDCYSATGALAAFSLLATSTDPAFTTGNVTYTVEFAGGDNVLTLNGGNNSVSAAAGTPVNWPAVTVSYAKAGTGTYRIVPTWNNGRGNAILFTVTLREEIDLTKIDLHGKTMTVKNGDQVNLIPLTGLSQDARVTWTMVNDATNAADMTAMGIGVAGSNLIPAFTATNTSAADITMTFTLSAAYADGSCAVAGGASDIYTIVVEPRTGIDYDLVADAVASEVVCFGSAFTNIAFSATDNITHTGTLAYRVEFVSGEDIFGKPSGNVTNWTPAATKAGKGTYRVVPIVDNREGVAATFSLEARQVLTGLITQGNISYQNGDAVPTIDLTSSLPAGASVTWTSTVQTIGIAAAGTGTIQGFVAQNTTAADITSTINWSLSYTDGAACTETGSFTITVTPRTVGVYDLVADAVAGQVVCFGDAFTAINFSATDQGVAVGAGATYRVEFVSGEDIFGKPAGNVTSWQPVATKAGKGTYRVVPLVDNREGVAATFSLEARQVLTGLINQGNLSYQNGDAVPAIDLTSSLPAGASVTWTSTVQTIGIAAAGTGIIQGFVAQNTTAADITSTINWTLSYTDGAACTETGSFTVTVTPKTGVDYDLVAGAVAGQVVCYGSAFTNIVFSATDNITHTGTLAYRVEFVSGEDIFGKPAGNVTSWQPVATKAGKGTYRVVPLVDNREGVAATFSLEARQVLTGLINQGNLSYQNGDAVPAIDLTSSLPAGASVTWTSTVQTIGIAAAGTGTIQGFVAQNTTAADITSTINWTLSYTDGAACTATGTFDITVTPKTNVDYDLVVGAVAGQVVCFGDAFTAINFSATDQGVAVGAGATYRVEFVEGEDIFTKSAATATSWTPVATKAGKGVYRVVPIFENREGVAATFSLEARQVLTGLINQGNLSYQNGDAVPTIDLTSSLPAGASVTWTSTVQTIGIAAGGTGTIQGFVAQNTTAADITSTINWTLSYSDGAACTATGSFTVTVTPKTGVDYDLVADAVAGQVVCFGDAFTAINFSATDRGAAVGAGATYRVEFVEGEDIFTKSAATATSWIPVATKAGKGVYRVIPIFENREGVAATFSLEARQSLGGLITQGNISYRNGDAIPAIDLSTNLPAGVTLTWTSNNTAIGLAPAAGSGIIPGFVAKNTTGADIFSTIAWTVQYADGAACTATGTFDITVTPKTGVDYDLVAGDIAGQVVCFGDAFTAINFSATDRGTPVAATYRVEFVEGEDIFTKPIGNPGINWTPVATKVGRGVYRVVPIFENREGVAATFSLEARQSLAGLITQGNLSYQNGDAVPAIDLTSSLPAGASVTWTSDIQTIGIAAAGTGIIQGFVAQNTTSADVISTISWTLSYTDGAACTTAETGSFTVTVTPKTNVDYDLVAGEIAGQVRCLGDAFAAINFSATDRGAAVVATYRVEFVEGEDIFTKSAATATSWTPVATKAGKGVYRVVPIFENREGVAATFSLEARQSLAGLINQGNLSYQNGDAVPAIDLTSSLPAGASVIWTSTDQTIGVAAGGTGIIQGFIARNTTAANVVSTINWTLSYADGAACTTAETGSFDITVTPKTNVDYDLVAGAVAGQVVCLGDAFAAINFSATDRGTAVVATYRVEFVEGEDIFGKPAGNVAGWTPAATKAGKGVYRVVPIFENREGVAATFSLEARQVLTGLITQGNISYQNGDNVPALDISTNLPAGVTLTWTSSNAAIGLAPVAGSGIIPGFVAKNTTGADIFSTIAWTVQYADGAACTTTGTFDITVTPKTGVDYDLVAGAVAGQVVCFGTAFTDIVFTATDNITHTGTLAYRVEFVSGEDIFGKPSGNVTNWTPAATKAGKGVYRVVPLVDNREGVAATFSLEARQVLTGLITQGNISYQNGDNVPALDISTNLPAGATLTWTSSNAAIGLVPATGSGIISGFVAKNTTGADIFSTIAWTVQYADGAACTATGTFDITVTPKTGVDYDLVAGAVAGQVVCFGTAFTDIVFSATDNITHTGTLAYRVEFVSGEDIFGKPSGNVTNWTPAATKAGKGVYRVVPLVDNREGVATTFSLEARQVLTGLITQGNISYQNGDAIPALDLSTNLPAGATLTWTSSNAAIGLVPAAGSGIIPGFVGTNLTAAAISSTIGWSVQYADGAACTATGSFTITVTPKTNVDYDLVAGAVAGQVVCFGSAFTAINFTATDNITHTGALAYRVEFVSGEDIFGKPSGNVTNWTPAATKAGKGVYRVVPLVDNREGVAATFSLEARQVLTGLITQGNISYQNGDAIPALDLSTNLPAGVTLTWTSSNAAIGLVPAAGSGIIPGFIAKNTTGANIFSTIAWTVQYADGAACTATGSFTVTVIPRTNVDYDLVAGEIAGQVRCLGDAFTAINFSATDRGTAVVATYRVEFVEGEDIFGKPAGNVAGWTPAATKAGKGVYRVVPIFENREGVAATFSLEARQALTGLITQGNISYRNGDAIPALDLSTNLPAGARLTWTSGNAAIGLAPATGSGIIPGFIAKNTTGADIFSTIAWTVQYADGAACTATGTFDIVVTPKINVDYDLVAGDIAGQVVCLGDAFTPITFSAADRGTPVAATYRIEFISGEDIFGKPIGNPVVTWTPATTKAGKGVYRVVPIFENREGVAATFSLEARQALTGLITQGNISYRNGEVIPTIDLTTNIPAGATVTWTSDIQTIGVAAAGTGIIQGFVTRNITAADVVSTINWTLSYVDGIACTETGSFTITVTPKTNVDYDLIAGEVANQSVCFETAFAAINFTASDATDATFDGTQVNFVVEYVSGVPVLNITTQPVIGGANWQPVKTANVWGTGAYRVTPIYKNKQGVSRIFNLTIAPELLAANLAQAGKTLVVQNGDQVRDIIFTGMPEGTVVTWTADNAANAALIGTEGTGTTMIPAFTATNTNENDQAITVVYTLTGALNGCNSTDVTPVTFTIVVQPKKIGDMNLLVQPVVDITKCYDEALGTITFLAEKNNDSAFDATAVTYKVEYVSGAQVLALTQANATATNVAWTIPQADPKVAGTGTYRVIPTYNSFEGKSTLFNITVRPQLLVSDVSQYGQTMTVQNGDLISAITFAGNIPAGATVVWTNTGDNIGSAMSGNNVIPQFTAVNPNSGTTPLTAKYEFSLVGYENCASANPKGLFTIVVNPKKIGDLNLQTVPVADQTICYEGVFANIVFSAEKDNDPAFDVTKVTYKIEYVEGAQVLALTALNSVATNAPWTAPKANPAVVGTGTYRVTPTYNALEGKSSIFRLTVQPELLTSSVSLNNATITYANGDMVDAIEFTGATLPQGAVVAWELVSVEDENGIDAQAYGIGSGAVGATGQNVIPSFSAVNTTNTTSAPVSIIATYNFDILYQGCTSDATQRGTFKIVVTPRTIGDLDLNTRPVDSQISCDGNDFDPINLEAYRTDNQPFAGVGAVEYIIEFVDGVDVLDLKAAYIKTGVAGTVAQWQPELPAIGDQVSGKGRYRVTPRWNGNEGKSVLFNLTYYKAFDNEKINVKDMVYLNGTQVPEFKLTASGLPEGAKIVWQKTSGDVGTLNGGVDYIPAFTAINSNWNGLNNVATYEAWVEYVDCVPAAAARKQFTITVKAATIVDIDLTMDGVVNQTVCFDQDFSEITFAAKYKFPQNFGFADLAAGNVNYGDLAFDWELIKGENVIDPMAVRASEVAPVGTDKVVWNISAATQAVGSGTYRVTPIWNNLKGLSIEFTLTRLDEPRVDQVENVVSNNNSPIFVAFTSKQANVTFEWAVVDAATDMPVASRLGIPASGTASVIVPNPYNPTSAVITETIKVTPHFSVRVSDQLTTCPGTPMYFTISVLPTSIEDIDLTMDGVVNQTVCFDQDFREITFAAKYKFPQNFGFADLAAGNVNYGDLAFDWELIKGENVIDPMAVRASETAPVGADKVVWNISAATQAVGSGTYRVTPIWNNLKGLSIEFTLTRLDQPTVDQEENLAFCNNSPLSVAFTSKQANVTFEWAVVDAATDIPVASQLGIPANGSASVIVPNLYNATNAVITETIKVTPHFTATASGQLATCPGVPMYFTVSVLPTPVAVPIANIVKEHGSEVDAIPFTGVATSYIWVIENPSIAVSGTPSHGEGLELPRFTTNNLSEAPMTSKVTVTPVYDFTGQGKSIRCTGESIDFYILVAVKPILEQIPSQRVCEKTRTNQITVTGLPQPSKSYYITWTGGASIGLPDLLDNGQTPLSEILRVRTIPEFTAKIDETLPDYLNQPTVVTITVTPWVAIDNNIAFPGDPISFEYTVVPNTRMVQGYEKGVLIDAPCTGLGNDIVLSVEATGYAANGLTYQWYKGTEPIKGETGPTYTIPANKVDASANGTYYVLVTGECVTVESGHFIIRPSIVSQNFENVMTLNTNQKENGGIDFTGRAEENAYQWYMVKDGVVSALDGQNKSYLYAGEGIKFDEDAFYYVAVLFKDGNTYTSCPIKPIVSAPGAEIALYPNVVRIGENVTVEIVSSDAPSGTIKLYESTGSLRTSLQLTQKTTQVTMPNSPGIYLIRVTVGNQTAKEFKVIVK